MNRILDLSTPMLCVLLCVGCGIGWLLWKKRNWKFRYWIIPVFICYVLILIQLTLFPIYLFDSETLDGIRQGAGKYFVFYQLIPFASIRNYFRGSAIIQLIGNLVLLAPLAVFAEIFLCQRPKAWKEALALSSVSLLIEAVQLITNFLTGYPSRVADVDDLILNTTGIVVTIILTRCIGKSRKVRTLSRKLLYR